MAKSTTTTNKVQIGDSTTGTSTSTTYRSSPPTEYGWACPRCGRINAPWRSQCDCNGYGWQSTWDWWKTPYDEWWKHVYCDSDTFKVHPETTTWKAPSSVCGTDQATVSTSNPNSTVYVTGNNPTVGGSDYWDNMSQVWTNNPHVSNKIDPNTATTAWNNGPSTQTIHNGKTNYKE